MSPRVRNRRIGLGRMDAAIDAMKPLGFSMKVVKRTVNRLLKVYEGDGGWIFIEEGSYKLLIETILGDEESSDQNNPTQKEENDKDEGQSSFADSATELQTSVKPSNAADGDGIRTVAGSSRGLPELTLSNQELVSTTNLQTSRKGRRSQRDNVEDIHSSAKQMDDSMGNACGNSNFSNSLIQSHINAILAKLAGDYQPKKKRKRCNGWISSDEEYEIVNLFPTLDETRPRRKRKSRWDVKPEDL